jgi:hypothetical protein
MKQIIAKFIADEQGQDIIDTRSRHVRFLAPTERKALARLQPWFTAIGTEVGRGRNIDLQ